MADKLAFSCPSCGQEFKAPVNWAGREIDCPRCKAKLTVPDRQTASSQVEPALAGAISSANAMNPGPVEPSPAPTSAAAGMSAPTPVPANAWIGPVVAAQLAGYGHASFIVAPGIPDKILHGVSSYASLVEGERVLAVYDETIRSNGQQGFALTDRRLAWNPKSSGSKPGAVEWGDLESVTYEVGKLFTTYTLRAGDETHTIQVATITLTAGIAGVVGALLQGIVRRIHEGPETSEPSSVDSWPGLNAGTTREAVVQLFQAEKPHLGQDLHVAPDIPEAKLARASQSYLELAAGEEPLVLFDDTVMGSAKSGFCMTDRRIVWNGGFLSGGTAAVAYRDIRDLVLADKALQLETDGASQVIELTQWKKPLVNAVALALARLCRLGADRLGDILLISHGTIVDIGGQRMEDSGMLALTRQGLCWVSSEAKPGLEMDFSKVLQVQRSGDTLGIKLLGDDPVSIALGRSVASRWEKAVRKAKEESIRDGGGVARPEVAAEAMGAPSVSPATGSEFSTTSAEPRRSALIDLAKAVFYLTITVAILALPYGCLKNLDKGMGAADEAMSLAFSLLGYGWLTALVLYIVGKVRSAKP